MDRTERGTNVIVATGSVKYATININKLHTQGTVLTFKKIGSNTNGEISVVLINHGVQSLPDEASVS